MRDDGDVMRTNVLDQVLQTKYQDFSGYSPALAKGSWRAWVRHRYPAATDLELDAAQRLASTVALQMKGLFGQHCGNDYPHQALRALEDEVLARHPQLSRNTLRSVSGHAHYHALRSGAGRSPLERV
jgi:hypothetical protein